ncbi:hypothetical protein PYCCODRAFT_1097587 [Trametes coccinea BRFM310]|uniref:Uncharacterized protein n=1 Tax=Trametes coccinea (strain BRFM310) TaxID=1353009 RepID=A0A1Y2I9P3_TRAC3|nr:hypothetical protein PYCCODRAFT_1097587 [Trametes coccinea BRFM310]
MPIVRCHRYRPSSNLAFQDFNFGASLISQIMLVCPGSDTRERQGGYRQRFTHGTTSGSAPNPRPIRAMLNLTSSLEETLLACGRSTPRASVTMDEAEPCGRGFEPCQARSAVAPTTADPTPRESGSSLTLRGAGLVPYILTEVLSSSYNPAPPCPAKSTAEFIPLTECVPLIFAMRPSHSQK